MIRKLKVYKKYQVTGKNLIDRKTKIIPQIILAGEWLKNLGFWEEDIVKITCTENKLIIEIE